jgi:UDP-glucuronate 4-epimerase
MKKILITGSAGFIGYHVAAFLTKRKDYVVGIDNFNNYYDQNLKYKRAQQLKDKSVFVYNIDISETAKILKLIKENSITHIIHLAAQAGVRRSFTHPEEYITNNVTGFFNILEICRKMPHIVLLYASSSSVYGINSKIPFSENDKTDYPANLYGATKKSNEAMAFSYHNLYGIKATGLRYFTVYGPLGRPDMAYFSFANSISRNKPINVFNHGKMKRDFTYIDDIVQGTISALDLESDFEIFNLGNNNPVCVLELISTLEKTLNKKADMKMQPMQPGELTETYADIFKSSQLLNFKPKVTFDEGISKFTDWFINYQNHSLIL